MFDQSTTSFNAFCNNALLSFISIILDNFKSSANKDKSAKYDDVWF